MPLKRWSLASLGLAMFASACPSPKPGGAGRTEASSPIDARAPADGLDGGHAEASMSEPEAIVLESPYTARREPRDPTNLCEPARANLERAGHAVVDARREGEARGTATPWNHRDAPRYADLVERRFGLTAREKKTLYQHGFVVPARLQTKGYALSFHEIYQSQLPLYVSVDSVLHSVFKTNDALLEEAELELAPVLLDALVRMHAALPALRSRLAPETSKDLDLYLAVGRSLLSDDIVNPDLASEQEIKSLVGHARAATGGLGRVTLFGRDRMIDWSAYQPRGHYTHSEDLERYFRGFTWLSRLELNLVSRASRSSQPGVTPNPEETPREATLALALAELAESAGALPAFDRIEAMLQGFGGAREDVSLRQLLALRSKAGIASAGEAGAAAKLKLAIGADFARTARIHYMPQGSTPLPVIATLLGPRIVADATAITELVHANVPRRTKPSFADVAFMLGQPRARRWLEPELATYPELLPALEKGRDVVRRAGDGNLYSAWLSAVAALGENPDRVPETSVVPSFQKGDAYSDFRLNSAVAAYGQLKHNYVLVAGEPYLEGGCEMPDAFLEPALETYRALVRYARRGREVMRAVGLSSGDRYFANLEQVMTVLVAIAQDERRGLALSDEEKRFLSMIVEIVPPSSDSPGSFDGWYFDLFDSIDRAFSASAFLADYFTAPDIDTVVYAGASEPRLGLFVVDTGGPPRLMVGPVARAFEHLGRLGKREGDEDVAKLADVREPWAVSYSVPAPKTPALHVTNVYDEGHVSFALGSPAPIGKGRVELLGHHRDVVDTKLVDVGPGYRRVRFAANERAERVRVVLGDFRAELSVYEVNESLGAMPPVSWEVNERIRGSFDKPAPLRSSGSSL